MSMRCKLGGIVSLFFKVGAANSFFDFLDAPTTKPVDLSLLITPEISLTTTISGYMGTDTMPTCETNHCWYLIEKVFELS